MKEKVFQRDDCMVHVKWECDDAWIEWAASKNAESLDALSLEVRGFLIEQGVKRVMTCVPSTDERIYNRASEMGFVPMEILMVLPLSEP